MKKNIYSSFVLISIFILVINIFTKSSRLTNIIIFSVNLFIKNIFPSLFPMFIISSLLVEIGVPEFLGSLFKKVFDILFKANSTSSFVFFMSMLTGFPSSAKFIDDLMNKKIINEQDAEKILKFTFFSNPLFIINTIGINFLGNIKIGILIFIAHILGNIITGILFRSTNTNYKNLDYNFTIKQLIDKTSNTDLFRVILSSIKNALDIMINIFGIVTFVLIVINMIFKSPNSYLEIFITGIIEMTTGLKYLALSNISLNLKIITSTFFISFGGFSVHAQIMNILKEKKVKYLPFLKARIIHGLISTILIITLSFH